MYRAALILLLCAGEALAHPDHGAGGWLSAQLLHLLTEPDHLAMILAPLVVGLVWMGRRAIKERVMRERVQCRPAIDPRGCEEFVEPREVRVRLAPPAERHS